MTVDRGGIVDPRKVHLAAAEVEAGPSLDLQLALEDSPRPLDPHVAVPHEGRRRHGRVPVTPAEVTDADVGLAFDGDGAHGVRLDLERPFLADRVDDAQDGAVRGEGDRELGKVERVEVRHLREQGRDPREIGELAVDVVEQGLVRPIERERRGELCRGTPGGREQDLERRALSVDGGVKDDVVVDRGAPRRPRDPGWRGPGRPRCFASPCPATSAMAAEDFAMMSPNAGPTTSSCVTSARAPGSLAPRCSTWPVDRTERPIRSRGIRIPPWRTAARRGGGSRGSWTWRRARSRPRRVPWSRRATHGARRRPARRPSAAPELAAGWSTSGCTSFGLELDVGWSVGEDGDGRRGAGEAESRAILASSSAS